MQDRELKLMSGWPAVVAMLLGLGLIVLLIVVAAAAQMAWMATVIVLLGLVWLVCLSQCRRKPFPQKSRGSSRFLSQPFALTGLTKCARSFRTWMWRNPMFWSRLSYWNRQ